MPMLKRCCFSRNLRTGTIVAGVWSLIHSVLSMGLTISDLDHTYKDPEYSANTWYEDTTGLIIISWINVLVSFFTSLSSILLFVAVAKNIAYLMIPWMVMLGLLVVLDAVSIIFNILLEGFSKILIAMLLAWIIFTLINIYCELCVLSHYQEVKIGRGRRDDYMGRPVRYVPEVQHVHISEGPVNYVQSQHTVYSFHSQTLHDDEKGDSLKVPLAIQNGKPKTVLSNCSGRVLELRPVASVPSDIDSRISSNGYTGSIEMKVVDSIPVTFDRLDNYTGSVDMTPTSGKRPRRFRTVSESAVVRQQLIESEKATNSLRNIPENLRESAANHTEAASGSGNISSAPSTSDQETLPLTSNQELNESE